MSAKDNAAQIRLDERQHVEKPRLYQLAGLGWEIIDLDARFELGKPGVEAPATRAQGRQARLGGHQLAVVDVFWLEVIHTSVAAEASDIRFPLSPVAAASMFAFVTLPLGGDERKAVLDELAAEAQHHGLGVCGI